MRTRLTMLTLATVGLVLAACGDGATSINSQRILDGLVAGASNDTTLTPPPDTSTWTPTPGAFHGIVFHPGSGTDTIGTAIKIANVQVVVYPELGSDGTNYQLGNPVATFASNANGEFQSPSIAGGPYVVTFTPPPDSPYRGTYVTTLIYDSSDSGQWWISLPDK